MAHILIVDDNPIIRELLSEQFRLHGHSIAEASSAEMALPMVPYIDGAVVDGLNGQGIGVLFACQSQGKRAVLLSGDDEFVDRALCAGFKALLKPAKIEEVLAAVCGAEVGA